MSRLRQLVEAANDRASAARLPQFVTISSLVRLWVTERLDLGEDGVQPTRQVRDAGPILAALSTLRGERRRGRTDPTDRRDL